MSQLFNRYEFKYPMPDHVARSVLPYLLQHGMQLDPSVKKHGADSYTVNSLYFDSPLLDDYYDKAGGFLRRKKLRVRIYEPLLTSTTDEIWLEKKLKHDMHVAKKRIRIPFEHYKELLEGSRARLYALYRDTRYAPEILEHFLREKLRPHAMVRYQRAPLYTDDLLNIRVTLDSNIEACFSRDLCYPRSMTRVYPGTTVMEVKFSTLVPSWLKTLIRRLQLERASFSKYTNAVETLRKYNPLPR